MAVEIGRKDAMFLHLTLLPFVKASGELKTKPTQHSVKELRGIGIQPDVLICRTERPIPAAERRQLSLFTNVPYQSVIAAIDTDDIYRSDEHTSELQSLMRTTYAVS